MLTACRRVVHDSQLTTNSAKHCQKILIGNQVCSSKILFRPRCHYTFSWCYKSKTTSRALCLSIGHGLAGTAEELHTPHNRLRARQQRARPAFRQIYEHWGKILGARCALHVGTASSPDPSHGPRRTSRHRLALLPAAAGSVARPHSQCPLLGVWPLSWPYTRAHASLHACLAPSLPHSPHRHMSFDPSDTHHLPPGAPESNQDAILVYPMD